MSSSPSDRYTSSLDRSFLAHALYKSQKVLARWRIASFVILVVSLLIIGGMLYKRNDDHKQDHVARIEFSEIIFWPKRTIDLIDEASKSDNVKAIILVMDSPGGTITGSEALLRSVEKAAGKKPLVTVVRSVAASGGYMAAIGSERIFAMESSIIGSIGVYAQWVEGKELLNKLGVNLRKVESSPLKGEPSFGRNASEQVVNAMQEDIDVAYKWFVDLVAKKRNLDGDRLTKVTDGRVFIGLKALDLGLIDDIGGLDEARVWLAKTHNISEEMDMLDWTYSDETYGLLDLVSADEALGVALINQVMGNHSTSDSKRLPFKSTIDRYSLEGILTLWHSDA